MALSVNHQSQLRVPPTPRNASLPNCCANGKFRPELASTVVLPEPGGPMITYQGSSYKFALPLRFDFLSASTASSNRLRNCAASGPPARGIAEVAPPPESAPASCATTS